MTEIIRHCFYDIETLSNVFTIALWWPEKNRVDMYYLDDDNFIAANSSVIQSQLRKSVLEACPSLSSDVIILLYDLKLEENNRVLANLFGLHESKQGHFDKLETDDGKTLITGPGGKPVADVETDKDDHDLYLFGYNSANYDTTMLAIYLHEVYAPCYDISGTPCCRFSPTTAKWIRSYNDELFTPEFRDQMPQRLTSGKYNVKTGTFDYIQNWDSIPWLIRKEMLATGRNIDVARLNEKQSKVGLKRILGMLGHQILEFDFGGLDNKISNISQLIDLIAYNISDVVRLETLLKHDVYSSSFKLKRQMLKEYPELIFNQIKNSYAPNVYDPDKDDKPDIRRDRLIPDSSSAQFATKTLSPYGRLHDIETVSFMYPSEKRAIEMGVPRVDVLEESKRFFTEHFGHLPELMSEFNRVYNYYAQIRGKNFNKGKNYSEKYPHTPAHELKDIPVDNLNLFYYHKNGSSSGSFVSFSTGGIHGQEANMVQYYNDIVDYNDKEKLLAAVKTMYPNPVDLAKAKTVIINETEYKASKFLISGSNMTKAEYRQSLNRKKPEIFVQKSETNWGLTPKYALTSDVAANHNDFISYYPLMLVMMDAFWNDGLGYDRYHKIYELKEEYSIKEKEAKANNDTNAAAVYKLLRDGVKLILNAASGAGDANHPTEIQMNNKIISMRIIGQLFAWRVGQEQTLAGGYVPSTNTDGLYSILDETVNAEIIEKIQNNIGIGIEPERVFLISKDTNNRLELTEDKTKILSATGASLACHNGPDPRRALAHPAIIDWALAEYITDFGVDQPFNRRAGRRRLESYNGKTDKLVMFQNIVASSHGMRRYIYGEKTPIDPETWTPNDNNKPVIMQHYNRVFYVKDNAEDTVLLRVAVARKITPASFAKREREGEARQQNCPLATYILKENGAAIPQAHEGHETMISKINSIDDNWNCIIVNQSIHEMSKVKKDTILDRLDLNTYVSLLENAYEENWRNHN